MSRYTPPKILGQEKAPPPRKRPATIAIGIPTGGTLRWETTWSLVMAARSNWFEQFRVCAGVVYVDDARNHLIRWFLDETDCTHFLSLDSDISFLGPDLAQLTDDDLDCVSGCYYNVFDGVLKPVVKFLDGSKLVAQHDEPIMEVEGVGAGFVMFSRSILEKMRVEYEEPCPWFYEPVVEGHHLGEDFGICRRVRELGSTVNIDLRVQLSHYKTVRLTGPAEFDSGPPPGVGPGR
jgi:hypothetical protein